MNTEIIVQDNTTRAPVSPKSDEALERMRPQLAALDPDSLSQQNIDPPTAAGRALGAVPALKSLQPRMERECPLADLHAIAEIEDRANALLAANVHYHVTLVPPEGLADLANEVFEARTALAAICAMLVSVNLLKQSQVPVLNGGHSYRLIANDTLLLVGALKSNWSRIENKVPVTMEQIERLRGVAEDVISMVNVRDQMPQRTSEAADLRQRALTLLDKAYDEARRVVSFLRWHEGDADEMLPPLRTHAGTNKSAASNADDAGDTAGAGAEAGNGAAASGNGATGTAGNGASPTQPQSVTQAQINEALKVFAPPVDPKTGVAPTVTVPHSKPFTDA